MKKSYKDFECSTKDEHNSLILKHAMKIPIKRILILDGENQRTSRKFLHKDGLNGKITRNIIDVAENDFNVYSKHLLSKVNKPHYCDMIELLKYFKNINKLNHNICYFDYTSALIRKKTCHNDINFYLENVNAEEIIFAITFSCRGITRKHKTKDEQRYINTIYGSNVLEELFYKHGFTFKNIKRRRYRRLKRSAYMVFMLYKLERINL